MMTLNKENRDFFNTLIMLSRDEVVSLLPNECSIPVSVAAVDYPQMVTLSVPEEKKRLFVEKYVDELDLFGDDLLGESIESIFSPVTKRPELSLEMQALSHIQSFDKDAKTIYTHIWKAAYNLIMDVAKEDILYNARLFFTSDKDLVQEAFVKGLEEAEEEYER